MAYIHKTEEEQSTVEPNNLTALPAPLSWLNQPSHVKTDSAHSITITAGAKRDWFYDPASDKRTRNAPVALFSPPDDNCTLSAKVTVEFAATFDAGVLFVYADEERWAKLCFECAPTGEPMIVSVVTRGSSDDCNSVVIDGTTIYLRLYRRGDVLVFHYSHDGRYWHMVRHFTIGSLENAQIGFCAQSPTGWGCQVHFAEIKYQCVTLTDIRSGE